MKAGEAGRWYFCKYNESTKMTKGYYVINLKLGFHIRFNFIFREKI
jgi:hypothetical protein